MYKIIKVSIIIFMIITLITAILTLVGIFYIWFVNNEHKLLYIGSFVILILQITGITILFVKKGLRYFPEVVINKKKEQTFNFLGEFITQGTSATVVSNHLSWLVKNNSLIDTLNESIKKGLTIEIITPQPIKEEIQKKLPDVTFIVTNEINPSEARFTLINGNRSGAERLAIPNGVHPELESTIFDNVSCPQIIAMAKDIIKKSKILHEAKSVKK